MVSAQLSVKLAFCLFFGYTLAYEIQPLVVLIRRRYDVNQHLIRLGNSRSLDRSMQRHSWYGAGFGAALTYIKDGTSA